MAYDEVLAGRVRAALGRRRVAEKAMFGGVGWLIGGNLCVGVWLDALVARVGAADYGAALGERHVRPFDVTGRALTGWVLVDPPALAGDAELRAWVRRCVAFVRTLPAKA